MCTIINLPQVQMLAQNYIHIAMAENFSKGQYKLVSSKAYRAHKMSYSQLFIL